jgi:hypothetical protein
MRGQRGLPEGFGGVGDPGGLVAGRWFPSLAFCSFEAIVRVLQPSGRRASAFRYRPSVRVQPRPREREGGGRERCARDERPCQSAAAKVRSFEALTGAEVP